MSVTDDKSRITLGNHDHRDARKISQNVSCCQIDLLPQTKNVVWTAEKRKNTNHIFRTRNQQKEGGF